MAYRALEFVEYFKRASLGTRPEHVDGAEGGYVHEDVVAFDAAGGDG